MKIPVILAQGAQDSGRGARLPQPARDGLGTAGTSLVQAADTLAVGQARMQAAENAKRKAFGIQEAHGAKARLDGLVAQTESNLKATEFDPDTYGTTLDTTVEAGITAERARLTTAEGRALFDAEASEYREKVKVRSTAHRNELYKKRSTGLVENALSERLLIAGRLPVSDDTAHALNEAEARRLIDANPFEVPEDKDKRFRKWSDDALKERGTREVAGNPQGFLDQADQRYARLDPDSRNALTKTATGAVETNRKQANAELKTFFEQVEKDWERERQGHLIALSDLDTEGKLTPAKVRSANALGLFENRGEYEHYMTLATKPPKDTTSDVSIWGQVQESVWSTNPAHTEADIRRLMTRHRNGQPGLNGDNGRMALSELARKTESKKDEARGRQNDAFTRALDEGRVMLGVTTPMAQLDGPAAAIVGEFQRDLNAQALDKNGNVAPDINVRQKLYELLPKYLDMQSREARRSYTDQIKLVNEGLKTQAPPADDVKWLGWYQQQQQAVEAIKTVKPNEYQLRRDQLQRVLRDRSEILRVEQQRMLSDQNAKSPPYRAPVLGGPKK